MARVSRNEFWKLLKLVLDKLKKGAILVYRLKGSKFVTDFQAGTDLWNIEN